MMAELQYFGTKNTDLRWVCSWTFHYWYISCCLELMLQAVHFQCCTQNKNPFSVQSYNYKNTIFIFHLTPITPSQTEKEKIMALIRKDAAEREEEREWREELRNIKTSFWVRSGWLYMYFLTMIFFTWFGPISQ